MVRAGRAGVQVRAVVRVVRPLERINHSNNRKYPRPLALLAWPVQGLCTALSCVGPDSTYYYGSENYNYPNYPWSSTSTRTARTARTRSCRSSTSCRILYPRCRAGPKPHIASPRLASVARKSRAARALHRIGSRATRS